MEEKKGKEEQRDQSISRYFSAYSNIRWARKLLLKFVFSPPLQISLPLSWVGDVSLLNSSPPGTSGLGKRPASEYHSGFRQAHLWVTCLSKLRSTWMARIVLFKRLLQGSCLATFFWDVKMWLLVTWGPQTWHAFLSEVLDPPEANSNPEHRHLLSSRPESL